MRRGGEDVLGPADRLVRFYAQALERGEALVTLPRATPRREEAPVPRPRRRKRRFKPVTEDFVLAILQAAAKPLCVREIREQLVAQGREPLGRQGMSYVLVGLVREGKADRIEGDGGRVRALWQAL